MRSRAEVRARDMHLMCMIHFIILCQSCVVDHKCPTVEVKYILFCVHGIISQRIMSVRNSIHLFKGRSINLCNKIFYHLKTVFTSF